jgi:hypothetical protein
MIKPSPTRWLVLLIVAAAAVLLTTAQAADYVRYASAPHMTYVDAEDDEKPLDKVGIDLAFDGGLFVIVTTKGNGALGDAVVAKYSVDDLPENALEEKDLARCVCFIGVVADYPGGVTFEVEKVTVPQLVATLQARLAEIGFEVGDCPPGARSFCFERDGVTYRAVVNPSASGAMVYLGI